MPKLQIREVLFLSLLYNREGEGGKERDIEKEKKEKERELVELVRINSIEGEEIRGGKGRGRR